MDNRQFEAAARQALSSRDYRSLAELARARRTADPGHADAWFLESIAAEAGRNVGAAITLVDEALRRSPGNVEYLTQKARYHAQAHQMRQAAATARQALQRGTAVAQQLDTLGVVLTRAGLYEEAADVLRRAVAEREDRPQFHFNLATVEQFLGNENAARCHYERAITLAPAFARAYWALSELDKDNANDRYERQMLQLAETRGISESDSLYLAHALAHIDEGRGRLAQAIARLADAKARWRHRIGYDVTTDERLFEAVLHHSKSMQPLKQDPDETGLPLGPAPLFIVGMPRSGTTLVEQVLAAHSCIGTLGERQELPLVVRHLASANGTRLHPAEAVEALCGSRPPIARYYHRALQQGTVDIPNDRRYLIDKLPINFFYLGFVAEAMPEAKIVLMRRDPMDTGLANFRQLFALDYEYYNYSYDLSDTGRYCAAFCRLCAHWETVLEGRLHVVRYENLVREPEAELRSLLHYLGVGWEDACLAFHRSGAPVTTPSASQVRRPLHQASIGRWRHYGSSLQPLRGVLSAAGLDVPPP